MTTEDCSGGAQSQIRERTPMVHTRQLPNGEEVCVTLYTTGIIPHESSPVAAGNGSVIINFLQQGFNAVVVIQSSQRVAERHWRFRAVRLPSPIVKERSSWRVEKDKVVLTLCKQMDQLTSQFVDWYPSLVLNGLDQYDSSEDRSDEGFEESDSDEDNANPDFPRRLLFW